MDEWNGCRVHQPSTMSIHSTFSKKSTAPWDYGIKVCCRSSTANTAITACHLYDHDGDWFFLIDMSYVEATDAQIIESVHFNDVYGVNWHSCDDSHTWSLADLDEDNEIYKLVVKGIKMILPLSIVQSPMPIFATAAQSIKDQIVISKKRESEIMWTLFKGALYV
jgi:hypothetical protein